MQLKHGPITPNSQIVGAAGDVTDRQCSEQILAASKEKYRAIVENMSDVVFVLDQTGKLLFITPSASRMIGYEQSEMIGHNVQEFTYKEDLSPALNNIRHAISERGIVSNEYRLLHKNGGILWIQTLTRPLFEGKEVVAVQGSFLDITERKQAEEALKASEKKFRDLITNMQEVLYTLDCKGRITFISPSVESMVQYRDAEIIGHNIKEFIFRDDLPRLYRDFQGFLSGTVKSENEYRMVTKSGEIRWMRACSKLLYEGEEIIGVQGILSDITERKRVEEALRESEEKFRSLVETTSDRIWETDANGVYTFMSPRVRDLLGYEPEEVLGRRPFEFMPTDESARMKAKFSGIAKERKPFVGIENVNTRKDGRKVVLETSGVPRLDGRGNLLGYRGIDRDITERKSAEEVLQRSHDELELRVQERTAELERRNQELQNFTFAASHDLQEPLRKIQTFSDLLGAKYSDSICEQGRDYIKRMHETASRMRDVLQSLMKYSRLISRGEPLGRADLNEIAREVISDLEIQIRDTGAMVEIGDLPEIEADAGQMRQLFQNLLGNALKFSREGIQPRIMIHANRSPQKQECEICFKDNGIGFEERYLERIFKPFHRLHGKDEYGGVGMGLAICAKVVEHHNGRITATSTPGQGSTFIVTLPLSQIKARTPDEP